VRMIDKILVKHPEMQLINTQIVCNTLHVCAFLCLSMVCLVAGFVFLKIEIAVPPPSIESPLFHLARMYVYLRSQLISFILSSYQAHYRMIVPAVGVFGCVSIIWHIP
jgi:hypothetical protein